MAVSDTSIVAGLCAVVKKNKLVLYNVCNNCIVHSVKHSNENITTKMVKISPSNETVAWLQSSPNQLTIVHIGSQTVTTLEASSDYFPWDFLLWSPNGNALAVFSSLSIFIDVYSVEDDHLSYVASISGSKLDPLGSPLAQFTYDGDYFSNVAVSSEGDCIYIYSTKDCSWNCVQKILVTGCYSVGGFLWCRDNASVLVWQSGLELLLQLWGLDGQLKKRLSAPSSAITSACLSRCGRTAAIQSDDGRIKILDLLIWRLEGNGLLHCPIIHESSARQRLKEIDIDESAHFDDNEEDGVTIMGHTNMMNVYELENISETLYEIHQDTSRSTAVRHLQFCEDANYLASYEPLYPNVLWIWNPTLKQPLDTLIVLKNDSKVLNLLWHKQKQMLCATLSKNKILVWTPHKTKILSSKNQTWPLTSHAYLSSLYDGEDNKFSNV